MIFTTSVSMGEQVHFCQTEQQEPPGMVDVERGPVAGLLQRIRLVTAHQIIIIIIYAAAAIRDSLFPIHPSRSHSWEARLGL